jgi:hypothetical protein
MDWLFGIIVTIAVVESALLIIALIMFLKD